MRVAVFRSIGVGLLVSGLACSDQPNVAEPAEQGTPPARSIRCDTGCLLIDVPDAFANRLHEDSLATSVAAIDLAPGPQRLTFTIRGAAEPGALPTLGLLSRGLISERITAAAQRRGHTVVIDVPISGARLLVQRLNTGSTRPALWSLSVEASVPFRALLTPWVRRAEGGPTLAPTSGCVLDAATATCGGVTYTIAPFAPATPAFGTFQSQQGTGASQPITISFNSAVQTATVTIQDPTFAGNSATAFNGSSQVGSHTFSFSGVPGLNTPDTATFAGPLTRIELVPAPGDYVAYEGSYDAGQDVVVSCDPSNVVRGATVRCEARLAIPADFTVVRRTARGSGFTIEDRSPTAYTAGSIAAWEGAAIATSDIVIEIETAVTGQPTRFKNNPARRYTVEPRQWGGWVLRFAPNLGTFLAGRMTPYPANGVFGVSSPQWPDVASVGIFRAPSGPNATLAIIQDPVRVDQFDIAMHPALYPPGPSTPPRSGLWYNDQDGIPAGSCTSAGVAQLASQAERHEGVTQAPDSHYEIANQQFGLLQPHLLFEALYSRRQDAQFRRDINNRLARFVNTGGYRQAQDSFDLVDRPQILASLGCTLDFAP